MILNRFHSHFSQFKFHHEMCFHITKLYNETQNILSQKKIQEHSTCIIYNNSEDVE